MSADMSPYCSAHVEWLIMKPCMYVGYHDANNVSTFGGDPVTKLNFKTRLKKVMRDLQRRSSILLESARDRLRLSLCWENSRKTIYNDISSTG